MKSINNFKVILWDFDGVIMDSMPVRDHGFIEVLKSFPQEQVERLVAFHQKNGGLSRYVKFRYFFEEIRGEEVTEEQIAALASQFSEIMLSLLLNNELLIEDCVQFIKSHGKGYKMHIVSGSDNNELNFICNKLGLAEYFISIHGSPTPKKQLVENVLREYGYSKDETVLIGDSMNDYDAAMHNNISFIAYNNESLRDKDYINSFKELNYSSDNH